MSKYNRAFKTIAEAEPRLASDLIRTQYPQPIPQVFTAAETAQLMRMYAHAKYVAVQASRGADRCEREDHRRGMIHYVYLLQKAAKVCLAIESKMMEWEI